MATDKLQRNISHEVWNGDFRIAYLMSQPLVKWENEFESNDHGNTLNKQTIKAIQSSSEEMNQRRVVTSKVTKHVNNFAIENFLILYINNWTGLKL